MTKEEEKYTTLDTEQCKWWVNHLFNMAKEKACNSHNFDDGEEIQAAQDKILKALERQSCEDCVSRQAMLDAITEIDENINMDIYTNEVREIINEMPLVTATQEWIPVSERLPEEETDVLICNANKEIAISRGSYSTEIGNAFIWYTSGWRFGKVIAWQPLPKPYKER